MRRRLVLATVGVIVVVLAALVPPVVVLLRRAAERELEVRLSSQAAAISTLIADELLAGKLPTVDELASFVPPGDSLLITGDDGQELHYGDRPSSAITGTAAGPGGTTVRVMADSAALDRRVRGPLLALGAFAIASVGLGALLAAWIGRRLSRPLEQLARSAERLGGGDFSAAVPPASGVAEIDGIGAALRSSADRIDGMLTAERSFAGDASHQLRTGLAGIGLQLELIAGSSDPEARTEAERGLAQVDRLSRTIDELLALSHGGAGGQRREVDLVRLTADHVADWQRRAARTGRQIELVAPPAGGVPVTVPRPLANPGFVGQVVDVLVDNALRHGTGRITVTVDARSVTVADRGSVDPDAVAAAFEHRLTDEHGHGRGLALARRLAREDGGRLDLVVVAPTAFVFTYPEPAPS